MCSFVWHHISNTSIYHIQTIKRTLTTLVERQVREIKIRIRKFFITYILFDIKTVTPSWYMLETFMVSVERQRVVSLFPNISIFISFIVYYNALFATQRKS